MSRTPALDPTHTALLVMDHQPAIPASLPEGGDRNALLGRLEGVIADVRANGGTIAYERIGFTEADWDAIPASNKSFAPLADGSIPSSRYIRSRILIHHLVYLEVGS